MSSRVLDNIDPAQPQGQQEPLPASRTPPRGVLVLRFVDGSRAGTELELAAGEHSLGRSSTCQVRFDVDADVLVSGRHLKIWFDEASDGAWWALDLGSRNGTFINGIPTRERVRLCRDDEVVLGRDGTKGAVAFTVLVEDPPASAAPGEGSRAARLGSRGGSRDRKVTDPAFGLESTKPNFVPDAVLAADAAGAGVSAPFRGVALCCWCGADASLARANPVGGVTGRTCGVCHAEMKVASSMPAIVLDAAQRSPAPRHSMPPSRVPAMARLLHRVGAYFVRMSLARQIPALARELPKLFDTTQAALAELGRAALDSQDAEVRALPEAADADASRRKRVAAGEHMDQALATLGATIAMRPKLGRKFAEFDSAAERLGELRARRARVVELRALYDALAGDAKT